MFGANPWVILAFLAALLGSGSFGFMLGSDHELAKQSREQQRLEVVAREKQVTINQWARDFERLRKDSSDTALKLKREIEREKGRLATCDGGIARFSGAFIRLYDSALQTRDPDSSEPTNGPGRTADPEDLLGLEAENGRRWKACRDQLRELIKVVQ